MSDPADFSGGKPLGAATAALAVKTAEAGELAGTFFLRAFIRRIQKRPVENRQFKRNDVLGAAGELRRDRAAITSGSGVSRDKDGKTGRFSVREHLDRRRRDFAALALERTGAKRSAVNLAAVQRDRRTDVFVPPRPQFNGIGSRQLLFGGKRRRQQQHSERYHLVFSIFTIII